MEQENSELKETSRKNIEVTSTNVITSINGVDVNKLNEEEKLREENSKKKKDKVEEEMLNYNILFMLLGLGVGMVFGKFIVSNIAIAMCSGTLVGLVVGIVYTEYLRKKENKNERWFLSYMDRLDEKY